MKKWIGILLITISSLAFGGEEKIIVRKYQTHILYDASQKIQEDTTVLILEYQEKGYQLFSMDMAGNRNSIYVAYRFQK